MAAEEFPVEAGHIMMFAAAIGDPNPRYRETPEATAAGGPVAPPTFVQSSAHWDPDYPLRPKLGQPWMGSGATPSGTLRPAAGEQPSSSSGDSGKKSGGGTGLHAEQHYTYHRPLKAGERLHPRTERGKTWQKEGRKGGTMTFSESITVYADDEGNPVVTARAVGVLTGKVVKD